MNSLSILKVALENYLQAILSLPIKDRNEIAAFFTSDIVRARQPVASAGYKEGYLTKRGKNFGGWKRRYFVLQGSVLEYYESVWSSIESSICNSNGLPREVVHTLVRLR